MVAGSSRATERTASDKLLAIYVEVMGMWKLKLGASPVRNRRLSTNLRVDGTSNISYESVR